MEDIDLEDINLKRQLNLIQEDIEYLKKIKNPSENLLKELVKIDGNYLSVIHKNITEEIELIAVKQNGSCIKYVFEPTQEMKIISIKESGLNVRYIKNPNEELQLLVVKDSYLFIQFLDNPTIKVLFAALRENKKTLKFININNKDKDFLVRLILILKNKEEDVFYKKTLHKQTLINLKSIIEDYKKDLFNY